jgi:hypothetical protein
MKTELHKLCNHQMESWKYVQITNHRGTRTATCRVLWQTHNKPGHHGVIASCQWMRLGSKKVQARQEGRVSVERWHNHRIHYVWRQASEAERRGGFRWEGGWLGGPWQSKAVARMSEVAQSGWSIWVSVSVRFVLILSLEMLGSLEVFGSEKKMKPSLNSFVESYCAIGLWLGDFQRILHVR